jgi:aminoglycoside phosphotransferase (APT) family kinase protein
MAALSRHAPELEDVTITELGQGLDNTVFLVGDLVVRVGGGQDVVREARLLEVVGDRVSIAVPACRFADGVDQVLAYGLLPGRPLLGRDPPPAGARMLGQFLHELHTIDPADVEGLVTVDDADPREWLDDLEGPASLLEFLRATAPSLAQRRVLAHTDLGAEHILEADGILTGVIDWSDAAITDPALDFARLYRDFGPRFLDDAVSGYGGLARLGNTEETGARITFFARCAALEDLAFGQRTGRSEYERAATRSLGWLFPPEAIT